MSSRNPEQIARKRSLFQLIDSFDAASIDLALELVKGDRSLYQAAKNRYYPLLRHLDDRLGDGLALLHKMAQMRNAADSTPFMQAFITHYLDLGELDIAKKALHHRPEAAGRIAHIALLNWVARLPDDEDRITVDINLPAEDQALELPQICPMLQDVQNLELRRAQHWEAFLPHLHRMASLEKLVLSECKLPSLPEEIAALENLLVMFADKNQLTVLPDGLAGLPWLTVLDLEHNLIEQLPDWMATMPNLKELNLANNRLTQLPIRFWDGGKMTEVNLKGNRLTDLPVPSQPNLSLEALDLSHNPLEKFPTAIFHLKNLRRLELNATAIKEIPEAIAESTQLNELRMWNNPISKLPEGIGNCTKLEVLDLRGCPIEEFPESLQQLQQLRELHLNRRTLPQESTSAHQLANWLPNCRILFQ